MYTVANIKETVVLSVSAFVDMCIENEFLDMFDTVEEFDTVYKIFEDKNLKKSHILALAVAIVHNTENLTDEDITDVMFSIRRRCKTTYTLK